jgi:hypothetical protein
MHLQIKKKLFQVNILCISDPPNNLALNFKMPNKLHPTTIPPQSNTSKITFHVEANLWQNFS